MERNYKICQLVLAVVLPLNLFIGVRYFSDDHREGIMQLRKFVRVIGLVRDWYVTDDETVIGYENLTAGALNGMLNHLDPHSSYFPPAAAEHFSETNRGEYTGIGIEFHQLQGRPTIVQVVPEGPAEEAGLKADDQIMEIAGKDTKNMPNEEVRRLVKGKAGTGIVLTMFRASENREFDAEVMRRLIEYPTVRRAQLLDDGIGYLQIVQFNEKTCEEMAKVLVEMKSRLKGLIIDLRFNPGGMLTAAVDVASIFLPRGSLVVTTVPRNDARSDAHFARNSREKLLDLPLVILINEQSASASEILAGCLKDHRRAVLVGERTYGKASVQLVFRLPEDNSSVHLTTRHYYTPANKVIHGRGISPNIRIAPPPADMPKLYRQLRRYRSDKKADDVPDPQMTKAIEVMRKKINGEPIDESPATPTPVPEEKKQQ